MQFETFSINLNIDKESFLETLREITYQANSEQLYDLKEYEEYSHAITKMVFVGQSVKDNGSLVLVAPKKLSYFTPLPYLLFWIDKKSPGTNLLAKTGYSLPEWFFSSTCTDMALAQEARNFCFSYKIESLDEQRITISFLQNRMINKGAHFILTNLYYSLFPIAIIAIFTDYAVFPFLATMSKFQIKNLIQVGFLLFFPYFKYLKWFPFIDTKKTTARSDWESCLLMIVLSPVVLGSCFVYFIPDRFIVIPSYSTVLISITVMYGIFYLLNFYTISQMPFIIREIFIKQIKDIEVALKIKKGL